MVLATALMAADSSTALGFQLAESVDKAMGAWIKVYEVYMKEVMIFVLWVSEFYETN